MKKKGLYLLLLMMLSASFLISCSKDDNNENNENEGIVPSLTGAITKAGIDFNNPKLECTKITITQDAPTRATRASYGYLSIKLDFNDNLQVIIRSLAQADYSKDSEGAKVYALFKNCIITNGYDGDFTFNLLKDGKVVFSETLDPPAEQWWESASGKSSFTLNLDSKGKEMAYKGQIKFNINK